MLASASNHPLRPSPEQSDRIPQLGRLVTISRPSESAKKGRLAQMRGQGLSEAARSLSNYCPESTSRGNGANSYWFQGVDICADSVASAQRSPRIAGRPACSLRGSEPSIPLTIFLALPLSNRRRHAELSNNPDRRLRLVGNAELGDPCDALPIALPSEFLKKPVALGDGTCLRRAAAAGLASPHTCSDTYIAAGGGQYCRCVPAPSSRSATGARQTFLHVCQCERVL